jgi:ribonuclease H2 subunit C
MPPPKIEADAEEEDEDLEEVKVIDEVGTWDEMVIWRHEALADEGDPYVKGMEEWIALSAAIHGFEDGETTK